MRDTPVTQRRSRPVRYELIDKAGMTYPMKFDRVSHAVHYAKRLWPDQEQDEDRTGQGWDLQVAGVGN